MVFANLKKSVMNIATPAVNPHADTQHAAYHGLICSCVVRKSIPMIFWKYVCTILAITKEGVSSAIKEHINQNDLTPIDCLNVASPFICGIVKRLHCVRCVLPSNVTSDSS